MRTPGDCICLRLTKDVDLTCDTAVREAAKIMREASKAKVPIFVWVAIPCTAGCRLRHLNDVNGVITGDPAMTDVLIQNSIELCRSASETGGTFAWGWPEFNDLWKGERVRAYIN